MKMKNIFTNSSIVQIKHLSCDSFNQELVYSINIGKNSIFEVVEGNIVIDSIENLEDEQITVLNLKPIPSSHAVRGVLRITDTYKECQSDEQEIFFYQDNGILLESEYITLYDEKFDPCKDDLCDEKNISNESVIKIPFIGSWIKPETIEIFCYDNNGLKLDNCKKVSEEYQIPIICRPYKSVYDVPIYINGYDKNNILLSCNRCYLSYIYQEQEEEVKSELLVTPQEIIIPNDEFNDIKNVEFICNALNSDGEVINTELVEGSLSLSGAYVFNFANYLKEIFKNAESIEKDTTVDVTFQDSDNNFVTNQIKLLKHVQTSEKSLNITYYIKENINETTGEKSYSKESIEIGNDYCVIYTFDVNKPISFVVESEESWYIYDYSYEDINCHKSTILITENNEEVAYNIVTISLINLASTLNNNGNLKYDYFVTIKNDGGNSKTIRLSVSKDLNPYDEYYMYWDNESVATIGYYDDECIKGNVVKSFTSYYELAINNKEGSYGDWTAVSSNNVNYIIEQYVYEFNKEKNIVELKWKELDSASVGTKILNVTDENNSNFVYVLPKTKEECSIDCYINNRPTKDISPYSIYIHTDDTFLKETTGYVDFYQINGEESLRLEIKHTLVTIIKVYTDQVGTIKVVPDPLKSISSE